MNSLVSLSPEATGVGLGARQGGRVEDPAEAAVQGEGGVVEVAGGVVPVVRVARHPQVRAQVRLLRTDEAS